MRFVPVHSSDTIIQCYFQSPSLRWPAARYLLYLIKSTAGKLLTTSNANVNIYHWIVICILTEHAKIIVSSNIVVGILSSATTVVICHRNETYDDSGTSEHKIVVGASVDDGDRQDEDAVFVAHPEY